MYLLLHFLTSEPQIWPSCCKKLFLENDLTDFWFFDFSASFGHFLPNFGENRGFSPKNGQNLPRNRGIRDLSDHSLEAIFCGGLAGFGVLGSGSGEGDTFIVIFWSMLKGAVLARSVRNRPLCSGAGKDFWVLWEASGSLCGAISFRGSIQGWPRRGLDHPPPPPLNP